VTDDRKRAYLLLLEDYILRRSADYDTRELDKLWWDMTETEQREIEEKLTMTNETTNTPATETPTQARFCAIFAGRRWYFNPGAPVLNFMLLEAATRSMTLEELADFSARYRLRVEVTHIFERT
jgi:hypothetical protein